MTGESPQGFQKSLGVALFINKNQAMFNSHADQPGHVVHVQFDHQVGPVPLHSFHADVQEPGDPIVGMPYCSDWSFI
jgi:hypothetical protein